LGCKDLGDTLLLLSIDEEDLEEGIAGNDYIWRKMEEGTSLLYGMTVNIWKGMVVGEIGLRRSRKLTFLRVARRFASGETVLLEPTKRWVFEGRVCGVKAAWEGDNRPITQSMRVRGGP
jgi:hypothetical protein